MTFDLHNDASLVEIVIRRDTREVVMRWKAKNASWRSRDDQIIAGLTLQCSRIVDCVIEGSVVSRRIGGSVELDFIEYAKDPGGAEVLRFVLDDGCEIALVADSCKLTVLMAQASSPS